MEKFKDKYRIASNRLRGWDYSANAMYFITIVTQNRKNVLGKIEVTQGRASMVLSDYGKIVESEWLKSFKIRNDFFFRRIYHHAQPFARHYIIG